MIEEKKKTRLLYGWKQVCMILIISRIQIPTRCDAIGCGYLPICYANTMYVEESG
jgi:hypothetical protein